MRVLVAHNFYRSSSPSGENRIVKEELSLLNNLPGIEAEPFFTYSDDLRAGFLGMSSAALSTAYARRAVIRLREVLHLRRPDVMHVHNLYPQLSPAIITLARKAGVAIVHTVHNYRHSCIAGTHYRNGGVCTQCVGKPLPWPGAVHACYRGSSPQSIPMGLGSALTSHVWRDVDLWIALTSFMEQHLVSANSIPAEKILVRPTWAEPSAHPHAAPGTRLLFLGRLDEAKGIRLLLDGWSKTPTKLQLDVAGSGPLADEVARRCAAVGANFLGSVNPNDVPDLLQTAAALVVPSLWYEGYPRSIVEAMSFGRASLVSNIGSLGAIVDDNTGWRFPPTTEAFGRVLSEVTASECAKRGLGAKSRYESFHTPEKAASSLLDAYHRAIDGSRGNLEGRGRGV